MTTWKEIKLGEIADITMGQSPKSEYYNDKGLGTPFMQGNRTFGFKFPTFDTYTTVITKLAYPNDIIMSVRAPVGALNITPMTMCLGRGLCSLRSKGNNNQTFLYYLLKHYSNDLISKETGTVFGSVSYNDIANLYVRIPEDIDVQKKIAGVLSALDDKIELNNQINSNLEQQAQALLAKHNESINTKCPLGTVLNFANGFAFKSTDYLPNGKYKIITIKNVQDGKVDSQGASCINKIPEKLSETCILRIGDILLSLTGNVGRVGIVCEQNLLLNQRVAKILPKKPNLHAFLYFVLRQPAFKTEMENISKGTAQQNLSPIEMLNLNITYSETETNKISSTLDSYFDDIICNTIEIYNLNKIRDSLLPKLMSGEIDVSKVDIEQIVNNKD